MVDLTLYTPIVKVKLLDMPFFRTDAPPWHQSSFFERCLTFAGGGSITTQIAQLPQHLFETAVMLG